MVNLFYFVQLTGVTGVLFRIVCYYYLRYCPIIPTVLVNGAEGIGTAWSTKVPNYNPREIVENIRRMIRGEEPEPMVF